ncbi:MAG TPA: DUF6305 family protein [Atribacterota bacterium]|nr:DUF6305 family protein [Atribacterota bacterium]
MLRAKFTGNRCIFLLLVIILMVFCWGIGYAVEEPAVPTLETPLIVTTCGQSPGALMIWVLCKQIKLPCQREDLLKAEDLKAKAEEGDPYKTLIITTGTSMKGMGAAGVDIDFELARIKSVIEEAKEEGIVIVGAHIEGMARRVDSTDAASIELVIPQSNLLLIREDSNEDSYFTKAAENLSVPIITFKETLNLVDVFKELFAMQE